MNRYCDSYKNLGRAENGQKRVFNLAKIMNDKKKTNKECFYVKANLQKMGFKK